jgi:hypothetical protein
MDYKHLQMIPKTSAKADGVMIARHFSVRAEKTD